jgi:TfoX N-terminal domain
VAYDEQLAGRIRALVAGQPGLTEKKMFGGLAFLVGGNMAVAASGDGGVMVRIDPAESGMLTGTTSAQAVEMRGRLMPGWLRIARADVATDRELARWVERGTAYARSLPPKG